MEGKKEINGSGVVIGDENPSQFNGSTAAPPSAAAQPPLHGTVVMAGEENPSQITVSTAAAPPPQPTAAQPVGALTPVTEGKKKRGRPRKYGPDGKVRTTLSPMPISASIPLGGDFSGWKQSQGRPMSSFKKKTKLEYASPGERVAYSVGANFTPHVITVSAGEDVNMKILSFAQKGSRAICVLSANGAISNVTLRQPSSSGGTLTYEGRFEILSLSGSFMPTDNGVAKSRSGGMSVALAGPDGRVFGGGLGGLLVAAGAVQVVIGSFLPGHQMEQKPKKQRFEHVAAAITPISSNPIFAEVTERVYAEPMLNFNSANSLHRSTSLSTENNVSLPESESKELNPTHCEVSC